VPNTSVITKKRVKKLLKEILKEEPEILKEALPLYPSEVATKEDIKMLIQMMDKRFEGLQREMDTRFEALQREMNARFEAMDKRFSMLTWFMGVGFSLLALLIALLKLFG